MFIYIIILNKNNMGVLKSPRLKIIRRLGLLPGLSQKLVKHRLRSPGQHGKIIRSKSRRSSLSGDYKERLIEKQKLRFNYGITEKQLQAYYKEAKKSKGSTGLNLLRLLESRLDCVTFRLGFAATIPAARQLINHGHICVNNQLVSIPSFICSKHDIISIKIKERSQNLVKEILQKAEEKRKTIEKRIKVINLKGSLKKSFFKSLLPRHLSLNIETLKGEYIRMIKRSDILIKVKDLKVVEYYSR